MKRVRGHFSPEFLNRLSAIVMFKALGKTDLVKICHKTMKGLKRRLAVQGVRIVLENSGASAIIEASFDPNYGARPVERYMEDTIVTTLSRMLISGEVGSGCTVHIEAIGSESLPYNDDDTLKNDSPTLKKRRTLSYRVERGSSFSEEDIMD